MPSDDRQVTGIKKEPPTEGRGPILFLFYVRMDQEPAQTLPPSVTCSKKL